MLGHAMHFVTDFGNQAVVLPFAAVTAAGLGVAGWWRGMAAWTVAVGAVLAATLALKLVFVACAPQLDPSGIVNPSGHTAAACIVYGGLAALLLRGRVAWPVLMLLPLGVAVLFALSRLLLHVHTFGDVVVGGLVGMAGVTGLVWLAGPRPPLRPWPLGIATLVVLVVFHGLRLPAEAAIHRIALSLPLLDACRG